MFSFFFVTSPRTRTHGIGKKSINQGNTDAGTIRIPFKQKCLLNRIDGIFRHFNNIGRIKSSTMKDGESYR